jgi:ElaB/YqjD/DUF883 family membrane-anchored ribosome-binding protein
MGERTDLTRGMDTMSIYNGEKEPEEIRAEMEKTRAHISETVNIIQERLSPERLKEQAQDMAVQLKEQAQEKIRDATIGRIEEMADNVNRKTRSASYSIVETIKHNPVPAALAGLGLGWLLVEGFRSSGQYHSYQGNGGTYQTRYYDTGGYPLHQGGMRDTLSGAQEKVGETLSSAQEKVGEITSQTREQVAEMGSQAREKVEHLTHQVQDQASQAMDQVSQLGSQAREQVQHLSHQAREQAQYLGGQVQEQAQRAKSQFWQTMEENPLMVGAAALALGLVVGLSLPETPYENRLMGEARDNLMDKAQEMGQETMQKVQNVAQNVAQETQRVVKEEVENQDLLKPARESFGSV